MKNSMMSVAEAAEKISSGAFCVIAGSEAALSQLPKGNWIGGTSVYFVTEEGGKVDRENVFVTEVADATAAKIKHYGPAALPTLAADRFDTGLSMILIPAFSKAHTAFAIDGSCYDGLFDQPLMGWITGIHLDDLGKASPKVFDGTTGEMHEEGAVLMHLELPAGQVADLDIVNLFEQDKTADAITFSKDGFSAEKAYVNGEEVDFAAYVTEKGLNTQMPLVADYAGAMINVSFQNVDAEAGRVDFYAPVIEGVEYRLAKPQGDYAATFQSRVAGLDGGNELSCNCILNYLYGELEGKRTGDFTGPATFGEVAYILLNQTMVRMNVKSAEASQVA